MTSRNALTNGYASSRSAARFHDARSDAHRSHFLESCALCNKRLVKTSDIFMYRGDVPFCSESCRQEQMDSDVAKEKKIRLSSMKALRNKEQRESTTQDYSLRPSGTVAAA